MNLEKRVSAIESSLVKRGDIEAIYHWLETAQYDRGCQLIESLSQSQQDELEALAVARLGPSTVDPTKFPEEDLEAIRRGEMSLAQFGWRARELGLL